MPAKRKQNKDREKDKFREFNLVLYPENSEHMLTIMYLLQNRCMSVGILHDKDRYAEDVVDKETGELKHQEGELKKKHYHFRVKFKNPRYISGVAKELGIEENLIQFGDRSFKSYCEYILHWKESGKYQYEASELVGSLAGEAKSILIEVPKTLQFDSFVRFIDDFDGYVNYRNVYNFAFENGYVGAFLRYSNQIEKIMYVHNERICCLREQGIRR